LKNIFRSRRFHIAVSFGLSAVILFWLAISVDWNEVLLAMAGISYIYLLPTFFVITVHFLIRAYRWKFLLPTEDSSTLIERFDAIMLGAFVSYILPLRAGEFVRPYWISKDSSTHFSSAMLSVVVERVFDLAAVLITFAILAGSLEGVPAWINQGATLLGVMALVLSLALLVLVFSQRLLLKAENLFERFLPDVLLPIAKGLVRGIKEGGAVLKNRKAMLWTAVLTVPVWLSSYYRYDLFFDLMNMPAGFKFATVVGVFIALAVAAPSAPGFIGVYQAGCVAAFTLFGVKLEQATAYALITHLFQYIFIIVYGALLMFKSGLKFNQLTGYSGKEFA
jgi:uncharacterized protein (TIRG00374 family)